MTILVHVVSPYLEIFWFHVFSPYLEIFWFHVFSPYLEIFWFHIFSPAQTWLVQTPLGKRWARQSTRVHVYVYVYACIYKICVCMQIYMRIM